MLTPVEDYQLTLKIEAHQPQRRVVSGLATAGAQEGVIGQGSETHGGIVAHSGPPGACIPEQVMEPIGCKGLPKAARDAKASGRTRLCRGLPLAASVAAAWRSTGLFGHCLR